MFRGLPISSGIAHAAVCLYDQKKHNIPAMQIITPHDIEREKDRLASAQRQVVERLEHLREDMINRLGRAEAEIFRAQIMIIEDPFMYNQLHEEIELSKVSAETAVVTVLDRIESRFLQIEQEEFKERASDFSDIKRRFLNALGSLNPNLQCDAQGLCQKGRNRIVVAESLAPGLVLELHEQNARGFLCARGGMTSHAAIIARSLGIPVVSGIHNIHNIVRCGAEVLINGSTGEVVIYPDEQDINIHVAERPSQVIVDPLMHVDVMANIRFSTDVQQVIRMKAKGIGLYRTEFEFIRAGRTLDEAEQYERYRRVMELMSDSTVYFRLLDIGGDKTYAFLDMPKEDNPHLGCRGARFLLYHPELLRIQARALAAVSRFGKVYVLYPMIVSVDQFIALKRIFEDSIKDIDIGIIYHGVMFEVPSACLQAEELMEISDFASIGTNDLIQFLFAVDRNNELVSDDYDLENPVFWDLISRVTLAAKKVDKPISICGELAGDARYIEKLLKIGLKRFSVNPRLIPDVRRSILSALNEKMIQE